MDVALFEIKISLNYWKASNLLFKKCLGLAWYIQNYLSKSSTKWLI